MATFKFAPLVTESVPISTALGVDANNKLDSNDIGKAVKLAAADNYVACATGNDIEGVLLGVEAHTVNDGFAFGTVKIDGTVEAEVAAAEAGAIAIGTFVVAGIPVANNTAGNMMIITGAGVAFKWRIIRHITGTGVSGDIVLIQRV